MQSAIGESGCVPRRTVIAIETHIPWRRKKTKQIVHCGDAPCGNTYGTFRHVRHCALIALSHNRRSYMASLTPAFALWKMKGGVHLTAAVFRVLCVCVCSTTLPRPTNSRPKLRWLVQTTPKHLPLVKQSVLWYTGRCPFHIQKPYPKHYSNSFRRDTSSLYTTASLDLFRSAASVV